MIIQDIRLTISCAGPWMPMAHVEVDIETAGIFVGMVQATCKVVNNGQFGPDPLVFKSGAGTVHTYEGDIDPMGVVEDEIVYAEVDVDWIKAGTDTGTSAPVAAPDCPGPKGQAKAAGSKAKKKSSRKKKAAKKSASTRVSGS